MFVTFEGIEGAGKSTQIRRLAERIAAMGRRVLATREPGDGPLGPELRRLVLSPPDNIAIDDRTELFLMLADRAQHVAHLIRPALDAGAIVLCDRYADSSVAYQGYGRGLDPEFIDCANRVATGGLQPDLTVLLDLDPAVGLARQKERNRMESEAAAFHERVRGGFAALALRDPGRFVVIDGGQPEDSVHEAIWTVVSARLAQ